MGPQKSPHFPLLTPVLNPTPTLPEQLGNKEGPHSERLKKPQVKRMAAAGSKEQSLEAAQGPSPD